MADHLSTLSSHSFLGISYAPSPSTMATLSAYLFLDSHIRNNGSTGEPGIVRAISQRAAMQRFPAYPCTPNMTDRKCRHRYNMGKQFRANSIQKLFRTAHFRSWLRWSDGLTRKIIQLLVKLSTMFHEGNHADYYKQLVMDAKRRYSEELDSIAHSCESTQSHHYSRI